MQNNSSLPAAELYSAAAAANPYSAAAPYISNIIDDRLLAVYRAQPLLFSDMQQCTTTVCVEFSGVRFKEEELTPRLVVTPEDCNIVGFKSNFGVWPAEVPAAAATGRGRKPRKKAVRKGKVKGTGECFDSQILFKVAGSYVRLKPKIEDKHVGVPIDAEYQRIPTLYKIKVFQNGCVTIPGVLDYNMRDIEVPLQDLERYLRRYMPDATVQRKYPVMVNFKFLLNSNVISIPDLEAYVRRVIADFRGLNIDVLRRVCITPVAASHTSASSAAQSSNIAAGTAGTANGWSAAIRNGTPPKTYEQALDELEASSAPHNICASPESLQMGYNSLNLAQLHNHIRGLVRYADFSDEFLQCCAAHYMRDQLAVMIRKLEYSNILLPPSSDEERQPALLIRLRTPNASKDDRVTKIKIFPSPEEPQKIAIDGANNPEEAEYIYWWFNKFLADSGAIYAPHYYPSDDPDFPTS